MLSESEVLKKSPFDLYQALDTLFADLPWIGFHPSTILTYFGNLEGTAVAADKLLAVHAVAGSAAPVCREAATFENVCNVFSNNPIVMEISQPLFIEEVFYGVEQIKKIMSAAQDFDYTSPDVEVFTGEIPGYVATVAYTDGTFVLPEQLGFAKQLLHYLTGREITQSETDLVSSLARMDLHSQMDMAFLDEFDDSTVTRLISCYLFRPMEQIRAKKSNRA